MASGTNVADVGETPNATEPAFWSSRSSSSSALRNSACAARARARKARPGSVSTTPVGVLWRSRACNCASSRRTLRVIAGCDTPSFRAAARMPPDSTTATKSRIWLSRMVITVLYRADDLVILPPRNTSCLYLRSRGATFLAFQRPPEAGNPVRNRAAHKPRAEQAPLLRSDLIAG